MNLFMLTAPYQLLSALEAIHHFGLTDNHLRVIDTGHFTRAQFDSVIDPLLWQSVEYHNLRYKLTDRDFEKNRPQNLWEHFLEHCLLFDQFMKRQRVHWIVRGTGQIDKLFLGNYKRDYDGHMRHFANRLRYHSLYLLDVGSDTLQVFCDRQADQAANSVQVEGPRCGFARLKRWLKRTLIDWDMRGVDRLTFFTAYDLEPIGGDSVVRNDYAFLRSMVAGKKSSDKVLFAGQPLVDQRYLTLDSFRFCMESVRSCFAGQRLVYVRHPRESEEQLSIVRALGIDIQHFTAPFEHAVSFGDERPHSIASFFSSVLETSAEIFGGAVVVKAFRLPETLLQKDQESIARVYDQLAAKRPVRVEIVEMPLPTKGGIEDDR